MLDVDGGGNKKAVRARHARTAVYPGMFTVVIMRSGWRGRILSHSGFLFTFEEFKSVLASGIQKQSSNNALPSQPLEEVYIQFTAAMPTDDDSLPRTSVLGLQTYRCTPVPWARLHYSGDAYTTVSLFVKYCTKCHDLMIFNRGRRGAVNRDPYFALQQLRHRPKKKKKDTPMYY